jgi:hypothetical protein
MNESIHGHYSITRGKINRVGFRLNQDTMMQFSQLNNIVVGSLLIIRIDAMEDHIALYVEKVDD